MKLFHSHYFKVVERSNVIQFDDMGYPLRLCIVKCSCGETDQMWIDTTERNEDIVLKWSEGE